ncbi:Outer membrane receptor proteins, mostly Fe transport [Pedobacter steynii]|uniref:Outer membrane receptor proteins, mostly Fe transport n=1 Tax=Pedobacter steynii TaxID=430522 RepID=A0A1G9P907_9SPHI|nr:TonB-dependent receptor [Pedobacter steynii]NQX39056.1 TonB-dependent receptor [Pedobacter steynii]SDL95240.1 Outer membrane receptor proteins, mostly Fe transport [Pedobacter steynii]
MKFLPVFLLALLLQSLSSLAQNKDSTTISKKKALKQAIKGTVIDRATKLPLQGATIMLSSSPSLKQAISDPQGEFRLVNVPLGRQTLQVTLVGYQQVTLTELLITSGKELVLNLELDAQTNKLNEVMVNASSGKKPLNQMALTSGRSFSPEETNRYAGAFFDPARMAQSFAGVVAGGDNNEIIVRGNSPKSLQWRLEGVEIINPNHFGSEGSSGGGISMINTTVLSTSDFYTGGLAAEYSNASSGVFDLKFRKGNTDKREYAFNIGVLGAGATLEGPFKKGGAASYLVSYRYSSLSLLEKVGVKVSDTGTPNYQDLSFNFVFPTKKTGTFSVFGIGGLSTLGQDAKRDYTKWKERKDGWDTRFDYNAGSTGLKHLYIASNKLYFNNIISISGSRSSNKIDTLDYGYNNSLYSRNLYTNTAIRYAGIANYNINSTNVIRAGINASFLSYNLYGQGYETAQKKLKELINQKGNTSSYDAFVQHKVELNSRLTLNTGLHANYFNMSKSWAIEPRLGLNLVLPAKQQLSFGAGLYNRLEPLSYYFAKSAVSQGQISEVSDNKLQPTKSAQAVLGYEKLFGNSLKFKTEVYYQHLYNVPVSVDPLVNFSTLNESDNSAISSSAYRSLVNKGTGKNYGIELSIEKSLSNGYYFMATSSFFDSKFKALSKQEFNTAFNTRFVGNLLLGKEWKTSRNNLFGLNGKLIYAGGRRYTPVLEEESMRLDENVIDQNKINTLTADPYMRVDFSASYRINSKKVSHMIIMDIQNVLNKKNTIGMRYNSSKRIIEPQKWSGMIPTLNYRLEF